jgi:transposase
VKQAVIGIDVSKKTLQVALLFPESKPKQKCFDNQIKGHQKLIEWIAQQGAQSVHACLESTSTYGEAVAEELFKAGHVVSIVNPSRIKGFATSELSRTKTDGSPKQVRIRCSGE